MPPIDTLVLDLDGPILEGRQRHYACYRSILERHGFQPLPLQVYWEMKVKRMDRRMQLEAAGAGKIYDVFVAEWLTAIEQPEFLALDAVQPGVLPALQAWKRQGKRLLLATQRHNPQGLSAQLDLLELSPFFDRILPCEHSRGGAGKAEQVRLAVPDLKPAETLWIGDTEVDIEAARALDCRVCAVTCGLRTPDYLLSLRPDFLVSGIYHLDLALISNRSSTASSALAEQAISAAQTTPR